MTYEEKLKKLNSMIKDSKHIRDRVESDVIRFHLDSCREQLEEYRDYLEFIKQKYSCCKHKTWWGH